MKSRQMCFFFLFSSLCFSFSQFFFNVIDLVPKHMGPTLSHKREPNTIEILSFSIFARFIGVCLSWIVVPKELSYSSGFPITKDYNRLVYTCFNSASNIPQVGGLACLSPNGYLATSTVLNYYKENAKIIINTFAPLGLIHQALLTSI